MGLNFKGLGNGGGKEGNLAHAHNVATLEPKDVVQNKTHNRF